MQQRDACCYSAALVDLARRPQSMQQYRQLPRYRDNCSFLRILPSAASDSRTPSLQVRVRPLPAQNTVCPLDEKRAQVHITFFGDWRAAGVRRSQHAAAVVQESSLHPYSCESGIVLHCQHKRQSDQGSHSADLHQQFGFRITSPGICSSSLSAALILTVNCSMLCKIGLSTSRKASGRAFASSISRPRRRLWAVARPRTSRVLAQY